MRGYMYKFNYNGLDYAFIQEDDDTMTLTYCGDATGSISPIARAAIEAWDIAEEMTLWDEPTGRNTFWLVNKNPAIQKTQWIKQDYPR